MQPPRRRDAEKSAKNASVLSLRLPQRLCVSAIAFVRNRRVYPVTFEHSSDIVPCPQPPGDSLMLHRSLRRIVSCLLFVSLLSTARAQTTAPTDKPLPDIPFERETLDNGMTVLYIPLHTAPVVHLRVIYHVGSRDERADRQ